MAKISLWVAQYQPKFFYVNTCFDPDYFNIQTLPKQVKNIVNSRYSMLTDFQPTLRFMNSAHRDSEQIREQRKARILQTDKYREENFGDVFPLLNKVLQIYETIYRKVLQQARCLLQMMVKHHLKQLVVHLPMATS